MKYGILQVSDTNYPIIQTIAGNKFSLTVNSEIEMEDGDKILGYWSTNPKKIIMELKVASKSTFNKVILSKTFEIPAGIEIKDTAFQTKINTGFSSGKNLLEISEEEFIEYEQQLLSLLGVGKSIEKTLSKNIDHPHNRIIFGAPGTGKSHKVEDDRKKCFGEYDYERVTFHPNYSYAQFVGTYKPVSEETEDGKSEISYKYVPGPFMRVYVNAVNNPKKNYLLLIEEINRANVAAVFGDMFQLLDRNTDGVSDYEIQTSEDVRKYLASKLGGDGTEDKYKTLKLPNNFYIWATMNSADQGVMPMDAAFKRRWDFEYLGIDDGEFNEDGTENETFKSYVLPIPSAYDSKTRKVTAYKPVSWNKIRHAINDKLNDISGVNEDKLLGPYFISKSVLEKALEVTSSGNLDEMEKICSAFKSKVLMYLFEDVVKMNPGDLFSKTLFDENKPVHYSYICSKFNENGLDIFDKDFVKD